MKIALYEKKFKKTLNQHNLVTEPYQPHSIPPNWGGLRCRKGLKFQFRHHLAPKESFDPPN